MFKQISAQFDFPGEEQKISGYWDEKHIFKQSIARREGCPDFVFYEGPPTANGLPGVHHAMARVVKDTICRYKTMKDFRVERKAGWDTQGLPVEREVEKELGFSIKDKISEFGIEEFNQKCRESVFRYKKEWDEFTRRLGFWLDLDDAYVTYTNEYIESVWWALARFHREGYLYRGYKVVPWCPRCGTVLSSHEVAQGYDIAEDPSVFVKMELVDRPGVYFLVWTTTPWTLISNVALAVHPRFSYIEIEVDGQTFILERSRAHFLFKDDYKLIREYTGADLAGMSYKPLYSFTEPDKRAYYVVNAEFVTTDEGTGIVHIAPAFGADDYDLSLQYDLPVVQLVDESGRLKPEVTTWAGVFVKAADPDILEDLKSRGLLYRAESYTHTYPFCWRCDSPLLYYARQSWFIKTTAFKDKMLANNKKINWFPPEIRDGRFGEWLENNVDWALSRERYWGTPLPIWVCGKCDAEKSAGSIDDLRRFGENVPEDIELHKPYVDDVIFKCSECGGDMHRTPEVIDAWFDSGSMPFAQYHYPFENKEKFESRFPADFIAEGIDQTRGWFYSLLAISTFLFGKSSYKNILVNELILDKEGFKMSKSRSNRIDPMQLMREMGADAMRWYMMFTSQVWLPTRFDPDGVTEVAKKFLNTFKNSYSFFALYASIDNFDPKAVDESELKPTAIDSWLESRLNTLIRDVDEAYGGYEITRACRLIQDFVIEDLSNWYIRRNRRRYWGPEMTIDKKTAYYYLWDALLTVCKLAAPVAPFITEQIYLCLVEPLGDDSLISVHLDHIPAADIGKIDKDLEYRMEQVKKIVSLGLAVRKKSRIKVRQPLSEILVSIPGNTDSSKYERLLSHIVDELNIKEVKFVAGFDDLTVFTVKPIFKNLGPKFGKDAKVVAEALKGFSPEESAKLKEDGEIEFSLNGNDFKVSAEDVEFVSSYSSDYEVEFEGDTGVALRTVITEELRDEGFAREAINKIQNMRKSAGFNVTDKIESHHTGSASLRKAIERHHDYICHETLSGSISPVTDEELLKMEAKYGNGSYSQKWNLNGEDTVIFIRRIGS